MDKSKEDPIKKLEVTIIWNENDIGKKYKVTRRIPEMSVSETRVFRSKEESKKQFDGWLEKIFDFRFQNLN